MDFEMTRGSAATRRLPIIFRRKTHELRFLLEYESHAAVPGDCLETLLRDAAGETIELYIVAIHVEPPVGNDLELIDMLCNRGSIHDIAKRWGIPIWRQNCCHPLPGGSLRGCTVLMVFNPLLIQMVYMR